MPTAKWPRGLSLGSFLRENGSRAEHNLHPGKHTGRSGEEFTYDFELPLNDWRFGECSTDPNRD